ncbi:Tetratricopeptide repeat-containing protein [Aquiflexum balticum DSM 16537]|uniref:Tetratricopeptide repeat-containing protein n=1 Tax=Aquiflexum balticum DSM 16537 TaxID=758820 RepID=A0A1W2HAV6_9BACT|nr:tetratricopeptide repeat protein [Aquiflexum balticum]SMD46029.1 Tetratricopeptide repeat-containing protein [Aquiflexum balticum DSM 16537]
MKKTLNKLVGLTFNTKSIFLTIILSGTLSISAFAQDKIIDAFKQSYSLEKTENFKGAIESLKAVYQSDSYELNLRLGWLTYLAGQVQESIDYYSKAVSLEPYAIEPKLGLALPLSVQGKWDEIEEIYQKILQIDPNNSLVNYRLGLIYYNRGNFDKADPYLEKVVNLYPFDYDGLILLAWNKLNLQKSREAKVLFQKVLMNNPDDASALEGLKLIK